MSTKQRTSEGSRTRRLSLTISFSEEDLLERAFLDCYDALPQEGTKRQENLRRNLLMGFVLQQVALGDIQAWENARRAGLIMEIPQ